MLVPLMVPQVLSAMAATPGMLSPGATKSGLTLPYPGLLGPGPRELKADTAPLLPTEPTPNVFRKLAGPKVEEQREPELPIAATVKMPAASQASNTLRRYSPPTPGSPHEI